MDDRMKLAIETQDEMLELFGGSVAGD